MKTLSARIATGTLLVAATAFSLGACTYHRTVVENPPAVVQPAPTVVVPQQTPNTVVVPEQTAPTVVVPQSTNPPDVVVVRPPNT